MQRRQSATRRTAPQRSVLQRSAAQRVATKRNAACCNEAQRTTLQRGTEVVVKRLAEEGVEITHGWVGAPPRLSTAECLRRFVPIRRRRST
jgi:hypothetical protein